MKYFVIIIWKISKKMITIIYALFDYFRKFLFLECGKDVSLGRHNKFYYQNMIIGNNVHFGSNSLFMSSKAKIIIKDHVMFGPHVYVITGNHRFNIKGRFVDEIRDYEKEPNDDLDVIFEGDNWIGSGCIILKGVTIAKGSIIGAGSVVTKSTEPNSIYVGIPAKFVKGRFED